MSATATKPTGTTMITAAPAKSRTIVSTDVFTNAMKIASSIAKGRVNPILGGVRMTTEDGVLNLYATDLQTSVEFALDEVDVMGDLDLVVPADRLSQLASQSTSPTLTLEPDGEHLDVRDTFGHFHVHGFPVKNFPSPIPCGNEESFDIPCNEFVRMLRMTAWAMAVEYERYTYQGVLLHVQSKRAVMAATDGRRLAEYTADIGPSTKEFKVLIPFTLVNRLVRLLPESEDTATVFYNEHHVRVAAPGMTVSSTLIDGKFPPYKDILPKDFTTTATVSKEQFVSAIRMATVLTDELETTLAFHVGPEHISITGGSSEVGKADIICEAQIVGKPLVIGFNPKHLLPAVSVADSGDMTMKFTAPNRPMQVQSGSLLALAMAAHIKGQ